MFGTVYWTSSYHNAKSLSMIVSWVYPLLVLNMCTMKFMKSNIDVVWIRFRSIVGLSLANCAKYSIKNLILNCRRIYRVQLITLTLNIFN